MISLVIPASAENLIRSPRDRHLDSAAGIVYLTGPIEEGQYPNLLESSIVGHEKRGKILEARGVAALLVETLKSTPDVPSNIMEDATDTLARLDKRAREVPANELKKVSTRYRFTTGMVEVGIGYDYEIYTRSETLQEKADSGKELCASLANLAEKFRNPADNHYYTDALRHCAEAIEDYVQLKDYKQLGKVDHLLAILASLRPAKGKSSAEFLNEVLPVSTLDPIVADREMNLTRSAVEISLSGYDNKMDDLKHRKDMTDVISRWLELAIHIGNKRDSGRALYYRGALHERVGEFDEAARDYTEAYRQLAGIGHLAFSPLFAQQLERNVEFDQPGGPLGVAQRAEKNALKRNDGVASAKAEEALVNIYTRLQMRGERAKALSAMLANATAAKSNEMTARAQYLIALSGYIPDQTKMSPRDRLMEAARLYRQAGDIQGEAMAIGALITIGSVTPEQKVKAYKLAREAGQPNLIGVISQFGALQDMTAKSYEAAREKAQACRDAYASIHAAEQVAHCEVLLADVERELGDEASSCDSLKKARDLFRQQGFPARSLQQDQKIAERKCKV